MASSKEQPSSRPMSGSFSRPPASSSRQHSHSISLAPSNPSHRVNRRKSVNAAASSSTAQAAIVAALREQGSASVMSLQGRRRSMGARKLTESQSMSSRPSMHSYFNGPPSAASGQDNDALEDNSNDDDLPSSKRLGNKNRNRRASEGSYLSKGEGKKSGSELRCDTCGKGYKHSSCLTKHLWEHDPAWAITSKLLISKHQQVQLLEAASVLCNMTAENMATGQSETEASGNDASEGSSASPGFSSSELQDELSSVETTPPPMSEAAYPVPDSKRFSISSNNGFSRSYRSIPSSSYAESVMSPGLPPHRLSGVDFRPSTSGTDDGTLAAAAAGLTFNSGTPRTKPTFLGIDVPPVPPLPQQYQSFNSRSSQSTLTTVYNPVLQMQPPTLTQNLSDERNYRESDDTKEMQMDDEEMFRMEE
ncbi:hypothetical protein HRR83_009201 [Exophiala dermatitidis]|uniref:C2H2-type domain-containing protein n=2 Tax=Exophiala dermatitidis TaxID=5970 RepID=H6BUS6_EXODN|nr:uncharacterized protein HMPREF1120_03887 [Exophiala dermatitidis NIH/UT8656]KAJ4502234.1 hypothetical protein HRR75_008563 [Exophiala dermatitidis]EHY55763.1 hypothetical protein HMPREF1120_03887 [Exophiala dermatitidis NIH/UT8656]KAJ4502985.1 hypothetical protein HRR73_009259 [Exophiala dermatitidis]KAJ4503408.1 hypothetical protein HRR74_009315 [Exophiala dermatitidis]KAJ4535429.1 hypothetical protein HRR77_008044 [Exophiala dermatitidis]